MFNKDTRVKLPEKFGDKVDSILKKLIINQRENTELANQHDWLPLC